jgi:ketosteroid isomerase-like protein
MSVDDDRIADRRAIEDVIYRYAHGTDDRDVDLVLSCFSSDAEVDYDGKIQRHGTDELRELFGGSGRQVGASLVGLDEVQATTHHMNNVLITFDGNDADVRTTALAFLAGRRANEDLVVQRGLRYHDRFHSYDGDWRIRRRAHTLVWSAVTRRA